MHTYTRILLAALLALTLAEVPVSAQSIAGATTTTLSANVAVDATTINVTSGTGFTVGNFVWADYEQLLITSVSGTAVGVRRGVNGTRAMAHDNTERVITGPADHFHTNDPDVGQDCTKGVGQGAFSPWINVRSGDIWTCNAFGDNRWNATNVGPKTYNSIPTTF